MELGQKERRRSMSGLAIHQGSGGLPPRANALARGTLIAAARENRQLISDEHIRRFGIQRHLQLPTLLRSC